MTGRKTWSNGNTLTANDVNGYLMDQAGVIFPSASSRDSNTPTPIEGQLAYLADVDTWTTYNGTAWVSIAQLGVWTSYTPTWRDGPGGTSLSVGNGSITGKYAKLGRTVDFKIRLVRGSTSNQGTTGWTFSLPFTPATPILETVCDAYAYDDSASLFNPMTAVCVSGSEVVVMNASGTRIGPGAPWTWAANDVVQISGSYEASS